MAKNKTTETPNSVPDYIAGIKDEKKRTDFSSIVAIVTKATGLEPKLWGTGIVGFGSYHYKYDSGHEGDAPFVGIAARNAAIVLYLPLDLEKKEALLEKLGKHTAGKGCIYIKELKDVDINGLIQLVKSSVQYRKKKE